MSNYKNSFEPVDLKNPPKEHVRYESTTGKFVGNKSGAAYPDMSTAAKQNTNMEYLNSLERLGTEESQHQVKKPPIINYIEKTRENYNDPIVEDRGKQTLAFNSAGKKLFKNKIQNGSFTADDVRLKLNENGLHTNNNRTIAVRDSFVAKAFNDALLAAPSKAAPARPAAKPRISNAPILSRNINHKKPIIKKTTPTEPVRINLDGINLYESIKKNIDKPDPHMDALARNFKQIEQDQIKKENDRWNKGLASFHRKKY